jgi:hypothetical protein
VWQDVRDATIQILQRTTFADLAERAGGPWLEGPEPPPTLVPVETPA